MLLKLFEQPGFATYAMIEYVLVKALDSQDYPQNYT